MKAAEEISITYGRHDLVVLLEALSENEQRLEKLGCHNDARVTRRLIDTARTEAKKGGW